MSLENNTKSFYFLRGHIPLDYFLSQIFVLLEEAEVTAISNNNH